MKSCLGVRTKVATPEFSVDCEHSHSLSNVAFCSCFRRDSLAFYDECHEIRSWYNGTHVVLMGVQDLFVFVDFSQLPRMATPSSWILTACKDEKHSRVEGHRYVSPIGLLFGALSWFGRLVFCGVCVIKFIILFQH